MCERFRGFLPVVVDVETGGFIASTDAILEVAASIVRMDEQGFYAVPVGDGELVPTTRTRPDHDFTVSLMTAELRYRWEIAPLTDLYVVYNRGNRLPFRTEDEFSSLLS